MVLISTEKADRISREFADIKQEAGLLGRYLSSLAGSMPADDLEHFQQTHTCGSATEKIYSGLERIVEILSAALDERPAGKSEKDWHKRLLVRASRKNPGVRDAIISESTFEALDRLRGFRHRERNSYFQTLDLDIVITRAKEAIVVIEQLKADIQKFMPSGI